ALVRHAFAEPQNVVEGRLLAFIRPHAAAAQGRAQLRAVHGDDGLEARRLVVKIRDEFVPFLLHQLQRAQRSYSPLDSGLAPGLCTAANRKSRRRRGRTPAAEIPSSIIFHRGVAWKSRPSSSNV